MTSSSVPLLYLSLIATLEIRAYCCKELQHEQPQAGGYHACNTGSHAQWLTVCVADCFLSADVTRLQRREFCSACACALSKVQEASTANQTSTASTAAAHSNATAGRSQESAVAGADAQDTAAVAAPAACESEVVAAVTRAGVITGEAADMLNSDMCRYVPVAEKEAACSVASASAAVRSEGVQVAAATSMVLTVLVVMSAWLML